MTTPFVSTIAELKLANAYIVHTHEAYQMSTRRLQNLGLIRRHITRRLHTVTAARDILTHGDSPIFLFPFFLIIIPDSRAATPSAAADECGRCQSQGRSDGTLRRGPTAESKNQCGL